MKSLYSFIVLLILVLLFTNKKLLHVPSPKHGKSLRQHEHSPVIAWEWTGSLQLPRTKSPKYNYYTVDLSKVKTKTD